MTSITETIRRVRELDRAGTNGPWCTINTGTHVAVDDGCSDAHIECDTPCDAVLIAYYRTAAPLLAAECERLQADNATQAEEIRRLRAVVESSSKPRASDYLEIERLDAENERLRERVAELEAALRDIVDELEGGYEGHPLNLIHGARAALEAK